jgi:hypothetical protein
MNIILLLTLLFVYINSISSSNNNNFYNNNNNNFYNNNLQFNMLRLRNTYLRLKLSEDVEKIKYYYKKMYIKTLNLYYDLNSEYYSLSDSERTLIETVISLSY